MNAKPKTEINSFVFIQKRCNVNGALGIFLDSKLSFAAHIKAVISKSRKNIGLLKYLSKYLPRHTLNDLFKFYVRPQLDYGMLFTISLLKYVNSVET